MCSQEKMMQRVSAGLVSIRDSTRMWPPNPEAAGPVAAHAALGSEAAAKDLLTKLDSMQAQVHLLQSCLQLLTRVAVDAAMQCT